MTARTRTDTRDRPFKVGVFCSHVETAWNGQAPRWSDILAMAKAAEDAGFDSFWLLDHLLHRFEGVYQQGAWDVWSLMAGLAATTERIEIAPLVACASFRNPALIAKQADTLDEISGGRFTLGLGAGWHQPEYDAFGFPYDHRVSRLEEALQIIAPLLRTGQVDFEGRFYAARECELRPRGPRPSGPPILIGGGGDRVIKLAATYADAWNVDRKNDVREVIALKEKVDGICRVVGRDPRTLTRVIGVQVDVLNDRRIAMYPRQFVQAPWPLIGEPAEVAAKLREYTAGAVEHLIVWIDPNTAAGVQAFAPILEALDAGA